MDPTAHYARVMRIKPEQKEEEWESVPYEEGWSQVKSKEIKKKNESNESNKKIITVYCFCF
ncbi:uncharacterized protein BX663DRAFT_441447 [Cokeromyces recurvatus]|uniref:uncharacterized protein n=1 Tax=Cokeromyces recurvatus TaxID=90255 RepID=UPI00221F79A1|nr:uncharacterized protein BX663DRAFT_441447 [Cokeromyces recurvatus]KAI7899327.1 hypothetical protein BX663DRAFT_441447 [Cokeromyces recurvatus]